MLKNELNSLLNPAKNQLKGTIGMSRTVLTVANRKGFVWVRLSDNQNELIKAHNSKISVEFGMPVIVEWDGYKYEIIGRDVDRYIDWGSDSAFLPAHAGQHTAMRDAEGADVVWVDSRQFLPLLVMPAGITGSHAVSVASAPYRNSDGNWGLVGNTGTFDLPGLSATGSNIYLMMLDDETFELYALTGTIFPNDVTGVSEILSYLPPIPQFTADIPVSAIKTNQTDNILWSSIYDVRQFFSNSAGGGTMFTGTYVNIHGDVSASGTGDILSAITDDAVTNSKLANMTGPSLKGRVSGTGDPQDLNFNDTSLMWVLGAASQNISDQISGTNTHFTFTGTAYDIWVFEDGKKKKESDYIFVPVTDVFDTNWTPITGSTLEVARLAPIVSPSPPFYPTIFPIPIFFPDSNVNWNTITDISEYALISSGAQNDEIVWNINLLNGTYSWNLLHLVGVNRGIYTLYINGVSKGTVDGYNGAGNLVTVSSIPSISIVDTTPTEIKIKMATKNGSSSGYYGLIYETILKRTGT